MVGLNFSGKDKSTGAKPPRRLSVPAKASSSPNPKLIGNITPISETRKIRYGNDDQGPQSRSQTPASDISKTHGRMKFNLISSSSYWLNQIHLSESAAKHSVSLGFFKLAWEARCEVTMSISRHWFFFFPFFIFFTCFCLPYYLYGLQFATENSIFSLFFYQL